MDPYTFSLVLGGAGLFVMAATGLAHSGSHSGTNGHAGHDGAGHGIGQPSGHAGGNAPSGGDGHLADLHLAGRISGHHGGGLKSALVSLASPRALFSLLIGFGLTGIVARPFISGIILIVVAVAGAAVFERALVQPLWRSLFRFASNPATTLESALMSEARAASGFDERGQGLVAIEVDGQIVQCLGTLRSDDFELGVHVRAGDVLRVEEVDALRSRCTVSYVGRGELK